MSEIKQSVISMPKSYWDLNAGFWKIKPEWIREAEHRDGVIAKLSDGTILKIGNDSNKK